MNTIENTDFDLNIDFEIDFVESTDEKTKILQNESKKIIKDKKIYRKFLDKQYSRVRNISELLGKLPKKNEQIRIITQKSFNAYAILLYILEQKNIEECYIATYNIDKNTIKGLKLLVDSDNIKKLTIVISNSLNFRMPDRANELKKIANKKIQIIFVNNHTKITCVKTKEDFYVIEGSGNLTDNATIEQYLFENCKETYNFHKEWIEDIKNMKYKVIEIFN